MDFQGFCIISKNAKSVVCQPEHLKSFLEATRVRVMEFAIGGGALCVNAEGSAMAMVEEEDILHKFECSFSGDYILPPNLSEVHKMLYVGKLMTRKGGYNNICREMVIMASLHKGTYTDDFLFSLERQQQAQKEYEQAQK